VPARAREAAVLNASPNAANPSVPERTERCGSAGDAPSAIRIPMSWTRCLTEYEITA
jgi:hypothetical protein